MTRPRALLVACLVPLAAVGLTARPGLAAPGTATRSQVEVGRADARVEDGEKKPVRPSGRVAKPAALREIQSLEKRASATYQRAIRDLTKLERARSVLVRQVRQARQASQAAQAHQAHQARQEHQARQAHQAQQARRAVPSPQLRPRPAVRPALGAPRDPILARVGAARQQAVGSYQVVISKTRELRRIVHVEQTARRSTRAASSANSPVRPRLIALRRAVSSFEKSAARERRTLASLASQSARKLQAERHRLQQRAQPTTHASRGPASRAVWQRAVGAAGGVDAARRIELAKKVKRDAERLHRVEKDLRALERQVSKLERRLKRLHKPAERAGKPAERVGTSSGS